MPRGVKPKGDSRNENKFQRYKIDWGISIKKAIGTGNYKEAVMTQASIIEDRLLSFLCKAHAFEGKSDEEILKTRLGTLINMWEDKASEPLQDRFLGDLKQAVSTWVIRRNRIAHGGAGSVKSLPGKNHPDPSFYDEFARSTAIDGERVVKSVQNWYRREKDKRQREGNPLD